MSERVTWMTDIAQAAEDLGYGIDTVRAGEIVLVPIRGYRGDRDEVVVRSLFLSGEYLRRVLTPIAEKVPA